MFVLVRESGLFGKEAIQQVGFTNVGRGALLLKQLFLNVQKPQKKKPLTAYRNDVGTECADVLLCGE